MASPRSTRNQPKLAIILVHGGVGDFLFQLDLAKRLSLAGIKTLFLARTNHAFFRQLIDASDITRTSLMRADGIRYVLAVGFVLATSLMSRLAIVNSFNPTHLRLPTRIFYALARFFSARILICVHEHKAHLPYEQIPYKDEEMIWERNNRIVSHLTNESQTRGFPILSFAQQATSLSGEYLHIHMVGSALQKSYPPKKLLATLEALGPNYQILLTMTPGGEAWYMTEELRAYVAGHPHITFISKWFSFVEIISYIKGSKLFCTVNTGLLWVAVLLGKKIVVCDTYTDYEWNPLPYGNVTRLSHDYDEQGKLLHLVLGEHEDGTYFESMYRVSPKELASALRERYT